MIGKSELTSIRIIGSVIIFLAINWPIASPFLDQFFKLPPYVDMALSAGTFIFLYQLLIWLYIRYFWRYQQHNLGGMWAYRIYDGEHESGNPWFYGIFEMIYTADELKVITGTTWPSGKEPDMDNINSTWKSEAIMHQDRVLWFEAVATEPPYPIQLMTLSIERKGSQITMSGVIKGVLDSRGERAFGHIIITKIPKHLRADAEKIAYERYGRLQQT